MNQKTLLEPWYVNDRSQNRTPDNISFSFQSLLNGERTVANGPFYVFLYTNSYSEVLS